MEQEKRRLRRQAARWERRLLTALATALSAELFVNVWVDNFRVSGAVVLYPVLLVTLMQDSRKPDTGVLTSCMVLLVRCLLGMLGGAGAAEILLREYPGAIFYLCYEGLFCLVLRDGAQASLPQLWRSFWLCDTLSNVINLTPVQGLAPGPDLSVRPGAAGAGPVPAGCRGAVGDPPIPPAPAGGGSTSAAISGCSS